MFLHLNYVQRRIFGPVALRYLPRRRQFFLTHRLLDWYLQRVEAVAYHHHRLRLLHPLLHYLHRYLRVCLTNPARQAIHELQNHFIANFINQEICCHPNLLGCQACRSWKRSSLVHISFPKIFYQLRPRQLLNLVTAATARWFMDQHVKS